MEMKTKYAIQFKDLTNEKPNLLSDTFVDDILKELDYSSITHDQDFDKLFKKLFNKYHNEIIAVTSFIPSFFNEETKSACQYWLNSIIEIYYVTSTRYLTLMKIYNENLELLMNPLKNESENKLYFNDTPQNEGGVFEEEKYSTTFTKNKNTESFENDTKIERIKKIQSSLRDLWKDWLNEFRTCFIEDNFD